MKYTRPVSSFHEKNRSCAQAVKAREIHKVRNTDLNPARGIINAVMFGTVCWLTGIAGTVAVIALIGWLWP